MAREAWVMDERVLARVRKLCAGLSGVEEKTSWGHPIWRAAGRQFAAYEQSKGKDCLAFLVEREMLDVLLKAGPRFRDAGFAFGETAWVFLELGRGTDWGEVKELLQRSHAFAFACAAKKKRKGVTRKTSAPRRSPPPRRA